MRDFRPDYRNIQTAARNGRPERLPLYEHIISVSVMETMTGSSFGELIRGDAADRREFFTRFCRFCSDHGYDVVPYEGCIVELIQGGRGLSGRAEPIIGSMADIERFPWDDTVDRWFGRFGPELDVLGSALPAGMKAVGGVGNGLFEIVQDFVPLTRLAYLEMDDPEAFAELWRRVGNLMHGIWKRFLDRYADLFAVCRFGDDLGFKSSTLMSPATVREHIIPQYRRIVELVHSHGKPFLLHSCGNIFDVMEDIIAGTGIDAKHSNEDEIAPFSRWLELYGSRIGNFGGVDMNVVCTESEAGIREYVTDILETAATYPGIAIGTGNSIADYVPPAGYTAMIETVREWRGERIRAGGST